MGARFSNLVYCRAVGDEDAPRQSAFIVFAGRSNAGKSSAINALCNGRYARVSGAPGCTRAIQLFDLGGVMLADFPGYGYAARAQRQRRDWGRQATRFMKTARLSCLVTVVDCRRGIGELDEQWMRMCAPTPAPMLILLNKIDKLNKRERAAAVVSAGERAAGEVLPFSATKKIGIAAARQFIARHAAGEPGGEKARA